jgi:hypothetical protein
VELKAVDTESDQPVKKPSLLQVVGSVLAAGFGVQSRKNRERDFKGGSFKSFILAGIIFTAVFIGTVYLVVSIVLENAR